MDHIQWERAIKTALKSVWKEVKAVEKPYLKLYLAIILGAYSARLVEYLLSWAWHLLF